MGEQTIIDPPIEIVEAILLLQRRGYIPSEFNPLTHYLRPVDKVKTEKPYIPFHAEDF